MSMSFQAKRARVILGNQPGRKELPEAIWDFGWAFEHLDVEAKMRDDSPPLAQKFGGVARVP